jgi:hypothetical protein
MTTCSRPWSLPFLNIVCGVKKNANAANSRTTMTTHIPKLRRLTFMPFALCGQSPAKRLVVREAKRREKSSSRLPIFHRYDHELLLGRNAQPVSAGAHADDGDFGDCAKATVYADNFDVFAANVSDGNHVTG